MGATNTRILLPMEQIRTLCRPYDVVELAVFGSVLRDDFGPEVDVDFLVTFRDDDAGPWGGKLMDLEDALSRVLGRPVDVVTRRGVEQSRNPYRRRAILESAEVLYAA